MKQARRREEWATLAATVALGGDFAAGRQWLARPQDELGAAPRGDVAAKDWDGLVQVLRLLEASWTGCTAYDAVTAPFEVGCNGDSLLREAKRFAASEAGRC
jgi:hypothetical protein